MTDTTAAPAATPISQIEMDVKLNADELNVVLFALNNTPMGNLSAAAINGLTKKINEQAAPQWQALQAQQGAPAVSEPVPMDAAPVDTQPSDVPVTMQ
jgi:hypothetical protein